MDILLPIETAGHPLAQDIKNFRCPTCGEKIEDPEAVTQDFDSTTSGIFIDCHRCAQKVFLHKLLAVLK